MNALLTLGADPNRPSASTYPLQWAAFAHQVDCIIPLLEAGADPNKGTIPVRDACVVYGVVDVLLGDSDGGGGECVVLGGQT